MNSLMAELRLVKPRVESSNLSSSAISPPLCGEGTGEVSATKLESRGGLSRRWRDHSHIGESPVGRPASGGMKTVDYNRFGGSIPSLSANVLES